MKSSKYNKWAQVHWRVVYSDNYRLHVLRHNVWKSKTCKDHFLLKENLYPLINAGGKSWFIFPIGTVFAFRKLNCSERRNFLSSGADVGLQHRNHCTVCTAWIFHGKKSFPFLTGWLFARRKNFIFMPTLTLQRNFTQNLIIFNLIYFTAVVYGEINLNFAWRVSMFFDGI